MENTSGMTPVEFKVVIKPEKVEQKTEGGLYIPEQVKDVEKFAMQKGVLVSVGALAFTEPDWLDKPKVGDKVYFDRYGGALVEGKDGEEYRLMNDKEIGAILK